MLTLARVLAIGCLLSGCSVIDALGGGGAGDDDDDDDDIQCPVVVCYLSPDSYDPGFEPEFVVSGELDTTGGLDLAIVGADGPISYLFHDGTLDPGDFGDPVASGDGFNISPTHIAVADFDNNGFDEVLGSAEGVEVYAETNANPFGGAVDAPGVLATGDFNGDDFDDVAVIDNDNAQVIILFGRDADAFDANTTVLDTTFQAGALAAGDFDGDDDLDIAITTFKPDSKLLVFDNDGNGVFTAQIPFDPCLDDCPATGVEHLVGLIAGDFDGDGNDDLAVLADCQDDCPSFYNRIRILGAIGTDNFFAATFIELDNPALAIAAADLDDDSTIDLVWQDGLSPSTLYLVHEDRLGGPGDIGTLELPAASTDIELVDLNGDGKAEIILAAPDLIDILTTVEP